MIAYLPDAEVRTDGHFNSDLLPKKLQNRPPTIQELRVEESIL